MSSSFPDSPTLNVETTKPGDYVRFAFPDNGYEGDQKRAAKLLVKNGVYTVDTIEVHNWYTDVTLREVPGEVFNSVNFANVPALEDIASC